ncbi:rod shape-determining protein [Candidatus Gottesmanbacteria bacterium RIFCSPHIGHO2_01_FULL_46_14]|uniref:Cell shape-determining protein MreB n=2 Tax=Candidatus Gottesmaniibacteriota TaxID=1752720 RepID=A0A1F5ZMZ6_9BACT|nr:MAG: rod shape-determining protein [Candidatus Gottesmanbacteria bacterium RIFCSPHIGHO2_01_FULL_46_14]OGG29832.1 MAG: rod shape-determining protein [Candidatus Gottesmanbacteria bacterium RIFCSPLOWO2_01_FULL_46_21]
MFDFFFGLLSHDLGIDLGTANTLVYVKGKGIVIREPSVVARHRKTKEIVAIGREAKRMLGKTPQTIEAFRPLKDGVIADFDAAAAMLTHYIKLVHEQPKRPGFPRVPRPKVVIGIPSGVTEVERRAVSEAAIMAGAREAILIEEPMAAAIGAGLPIEESNGSFICDIGGGTSEIAVLSLGGIVVNRSIRIAGDEMDEAITSFMRLKYSLLIGEQTAEAVKLAVGSAFPIDKTDRVTVVRGRDIETGLPKTVRVSETEIREAISSVVSEIIEGISETIEETPPELVGDIIEHGIVLAGGGALIGGIDKRIATEMKMPVWITDDPQTAVVRGCGKLLDDLELLRKVKVAARKV